MLNNVKYICHNGKYIYLYDKITYCLIFKKIDYERKIIYGM